MSGDCTPSSDVVAIAARCLPHIEQLLALQGDRAESELIQLQHELAALVSSKDRH